MIEVGVHEAKTTLSELLRRVAAGEEVTITRSGTQPEMSSAVPRDRPRVGAFSTVRARAT
ncbi:MAG: type II toxin-antitoxin system Phd/YefM family antitoxin [Pseudonocardiaceae bacterium]